MLLWLVMAVAQASAQSPGDRPALRDAVRFEGNLVFPDEVYLALLQVDADSVENTPVAAALVGGQILRFLRRAGYVLARVHVGLEEGRIVVYIDEGQLARVLFRGEGSIKSLRVKGMLDIPHNVYNKPYLDRQLQTLKDELGLSLAEHELVRVTERESSGPDLELLADLGMPGPLKPLAPLLNLEEGGEYELHIALGSTRLAQHYSLKAGADSEDGVIIKNAYTVRDGLLDGERWVVYGDVGVANFKSLEYEQSKRSWALFRAGAQWVAPAVANTKLHPVLWVSTDLQLRQRPELDIERYRWTRHRASLNVERPFRGKSRVTLGVGYQWRVLSNAEHVSLSADQLSFRDRGAFVAGSVNYVFGKEGLRIDKAHEIFADYRYYPPARLKQAWRLRWSYRKWFTLGWNDLVISVSGAALGGETVFPQDRPVGGRYLRGVFGRIFYVRRVAATSIEYRLAVKRDLLKLSGFIDTAVFEAAKKTENGGIVLRRMEDPLKFGLCGGIGAHGLVGSMFELGVYYSVGWASDGRRSRGLAAKLKKAF